MLLSDEQRTRVANLLVDHLDGTMFGMAAARLLGPETLRAVPAGANPFQTALAMLDHAMRQPTPALFIKIIITVDQAGFLVEERDLIAAVEAGGLRWHDNGSDPLWIPTAWPFADRDPVRAVLCEMAKGQGPAALAIEAPEGHGKKTMCLYLEHCAARAGVYSTVVEHLTRTGDPQTLDSLVTQLRLKLRRDTATTHHEPERQAVDLARDFARDAAMTGTAVWFVANIQQPQLDEGVLRFVDELLHQAQADELIARTLRVTVLADDLSALELPNLPLIEHRHVLTEITADEIAAWLERVAPGKDRRRYALFAADVMHRVAQRNPLPQSRLKFLALECVRAHRTLAESP